MYGKTSKSIPQKALIIALETLILWASFYILFQGGFQQLAALFHWNVVDGNMTRRVVLFAFNCVVYLRMLITMGYLLKREIPMEEALSVPFAFAVYYVGYAMLGFQTTLPLDWIDGVGIVLFLIGSFVNTFAELQRNAWKKDPQHKGMLYTEGLFGYSMHVNYFGDLLWVIGYAILTRNPYSAIIPVLIFCFFAFFNAPMLDKYLAKKYGQQFAEYSSKTKKFIPFIY